MASLPAMACFAHTSSFSTSLHSNHPSFFHKTSLLSISRTQKSLKKFAINSKLEPDQKPETTAKNGETSPTNLKFDRRNVLLGLSGLYGTLSANPSFAAPPEPDYQHCVKAKEDITKTPINCCPPPAGSNIPLYIPSEPRVSRTRMSAQTFTNDSCYYKKFKKAIEKMKNLPSTDPRNFTQQANVHCAYCDGGYTQQGNPSLLYEVHGSWLFFPWHRWYLYFFEKICQNMIDDDAFALPFWNWDDPTGMTIPNIFNNGGDKSPLYDVNRNPNHLPPAVIDLDWITQKYPKATDDQLIRYNLNVMYRQMITQSKTPTDFFGKPFRAGCDITKLQGTGSIENCPHNDVHSWTGNTLSSVSPNGEDMGALYSAGRDPIFFAHHANVDRMWTIWLNKLGGTNITDPDWLGATFDFYNEEAKPVTVRLADCLDTRKLGYVYEEVPIDQWMDAKPTARAKGKSFTSGPAPSHIFPKTLDEAINVLVKRPNKSGSAEEILVIEGIEYDKGERVKFKVYINEDDVKASGPNHVEYVGSFSNVPHGHGMKAKTNMHFRITQALKDLEANQYENVLVTLVPNTGHVKINDVKIQHETSL